MRYTVVKIHVSKLNCVAQASRLAAGLLKLGLVPGDRVAICSPNTTEWVLAALATAKAGLILVSVLLTNQMCLCAIKSFIRNLWAWAM